MVAFRLGVGGGGVPTSAILGAVGFKILILYLNTEY